MTERYAGTSVSASEIASALGVGLPAVSNWRRRHRSFPRPMTSDTEDRFNTSAVAEWLEGRKIPAPQRSSDEPEGVTYLDRFRRRFGAPEVMKPDEAWPREEFLRATARAFEILRKEQNASRACEVLLVLLWVLVERPADWDRLRSSPDEAPDLLAQIELPTGGTRRLSLLSDAAREAISRPTWRQLVASMSDLARLVPESWHLPAFTLTEHVERWLSAGRQPDHVIPAEVAQLMVALVGPVSGKVVIDPFSRAGELPAAAAALAREQLGDVTVLGQASSYDSLRISVLVAGLVGAGAEIGPSLDVQDLASGQAGYDMIVVNPPFNSKPGKAFEPSHHQWHYGSPPRTNMNFAWLQGVVAALRPGGRAAVLTSTNTVQSRSSAERSIRSRMVADGVVDGVIALPDRLFASTAIPTCLWLLRAPGNPGPEETLFVDATSLGSFERRGRRTLSPVDVTSVVNEVRRWRERLRAAPFTPTDGFSGYRPSRELAQGDADLNPRIHVVSSIAVVDRSALRTRVVDRIHRFGDLRADTRKSQRSATEAIDRIALDVISSGPRTTVALGSVCDVLSGAGNIPTATTEPAIPVVTPRNIAHSMVSDTVFASAPGTAGQDFRRYLLAPGDIIGVRSGNVGRFGLLAHREGPWLLGSGCLRIRPRPEEVDPAFLVHLLGTEAPQDWIRRRAAGSVLTTINADGIRELPIPLSPLDEQRRIGEILFALDTETLAHERAAQESAALCATVTEALVSGAVGQRGSPP